MAKLTISEPEQYRTVFAHLLPAGKLWMRYVRLCTTYEPKKGIEQKFTEARKRISEETGHWSTTFWPAARECGYDTQDVLLPLVLALEAIEKKGHVRVQRDLDRKELEREEEARTWEQTIASLPSDSEGMPPELSWIYNHPALLRKPRKDGRIEITVADVESAPGRIAAPSKGAVAHLKHWCFSYKTRGECYKLILTHWIKGKGGSQSSDDVEKSSIAETQEALGSIPREEG